MTNYGFHRAMEVAGIEVATTQVGDRHVLAELLSRGWAFGGEQSGHIIDTGFVPAGDGTAAALLTLEALAGRDLSERDAMEKLPQRLVNVRVRDRDALEHAADVREASSRSTRRWRGADGCSCAHPARSRSCGSWWRPRLPMNAMQSATGLSHWSNVGWGPRRSA